MFKNIHEDIEKIPRSSGLYYFYDSNDDLLYVGRAKFLKSRIFEHRYNNDRLREARYYRIIGLTKTEEQKKILERNFNRVIERWRHGEQALVIDYVFHRTKRIEIKEMPNELTESKEKEEILRLEPPFNHETKSEEYYIISQIHLLDPDEVPNDLQYMS